MKFHLKPIKNGAVIGDVVALDGTKITVLFGNVKTVADISNLTYVEIEKKTVKRKDVKKE